MLHSTVLIEIYTKVFFSQISLVDMKTCQNKKHSKIVFCNQNADDYYDSVNSCSHAFSEKLINNTIIFASDLFKLFIQ